MFNVYSQVLSELDEFFGTKISLARGYSSGLRYLPKQDAVYDFSQWHTINLIDLYWNSRFESGEFDSEKQKKLFLNVGRFRSEVCSKQIDLDTKNFKFIPEQDASEWGAYFMGKDFHIWAKENYFGDLLNQCVENYPRYGTIVLKKVGGKLEFVPLQTLRNKQDAKNLEEADYVIEEHQMTADEIKEKSWDAVDLNLPLNERETVYERYGRVPLSFYKDYKKEKILKGDENKTIDCLTICTAQKKLNATGQTQYEGKIFFLEKITQRPYLEVHYANQHGRWLGIGEMENQFQNQVANNMIANLQKRALLWASKKIFQSPDDTIAKNLVKDVKDGEILKIMPNGNISQIDMTTHSLGDFNNFSQQWEKNSDQKSFTYEVATGESLPSGTPFRLGVVLSNAVQSHFSLKQEKLGLFLKKVVTKFVLPEFVKDSEQHLLALFADEAGVVALKQILIDQQSFEIYKKQLLKETLPDVSTIKQAVEQVISAKQSVFMKIPENYYKDLKYRVELTITGEEIDLPKKIETMTNVYTSLAQRGDPRADVVLKRILAYTGENFDILAGQQVPPTSTPPQSLGVPSPFPVGQSQIPSLPSKEPQVL